ncbi:hypothetical protein BJ684DRAFT_20856 [Piptocephalis cylindrospora]|uniref:Uncharacterized protein n=1 Tax=Piptocephalis cylindrospora TaxID=1907219 RepID=A0A4P9Y1F9_9FUNG|nr:hypothetical protein BJ684DRAFT_20856 [Piptocephalis cylindrospora]|eukprot:RKP12615.1 hypothetical protein BJ684DRAFT_20856 [Piptocephalis cylindrospora]
MTIVDRLVLRLSRHHYTFFLREAWMETIRRPGGVQRGDTLEALIFLTHLDEGDLSRVVRAILRVIPPGHPLAPAFILQLLSRIALPSPRTARKVMDHLGTRLFRLSRPALPLLSQVRSWRILGGSISSHSSSGVSSFQSGTSTFASYTSPTHSSSRPSSTRPALKEEEREAANTALIISALAHRLAGTMMLGMVKFPLIHSLFTLLTHPECHPTPRLASLLALDALGRTGQVKERIRMWVPDLLMALKGIHRQQRLQGGNPDQLLGLAVEWSMYHIWSAPSHSLPLPSPPYGQATIVLDPTLGVGRHGKYAMDGLSCRNDHGDLLTAVASAGVQSSGRWYYEVTLHTTGIFQLGWVFSNTLRRLSAEHGIGKWEKGMEWKDG